MKELKPYRILLGLMISAYGNTALADGYGVFDARTQSLGGTGVALGSLTTGHFYNPALTAFHEGHEERTQDGSHSFHSVLSISDGARTTVDMVSDDLESRLSDAIDNLNANLTEETAREGLEAAWDLNAAIRKLDGKSINADAYVGYSISIPADLEGGTFFVGSRAIGRGVSDIRPEDYDLLDDYIEVLKFIESGSSDGVDHPELRDGDGNLLNPGLRMQSSGSGVTVLLSELGVSAAKQYPLWGQQVSLGIAPKVVHLRLFHEYWRAVNGEFENVGEDETDLYFNLDVGAAVTLAEVWRVGLAIKDVRSKSVSTESGRRVRLKPHARLGVAYIGNSWSAGLDADLDKTKDIQDIDQRQDVSLGIEYRTSFGMALRTGYRHDLAGSVDDQLSAGIGWEIARLRLDLTYAQGSDSQGAALHIGWAH